MQAIVIMCFRSQIVIYFLRTVRMDGLQILIPSQQPANNQYLAQHPLVGIATEKIVSIKSFKDGLLEKSFIWILDIEIYWNLNS